MFRTVAGADDHDSTLRRLGDTPLEDPLLARSDSTTMADADQIVTLGARGRSIRLFTAPGGPGIWPTGLDRGTSLDLSLDN